MGLLSWLFGGNKKISSSDATPPLRAESNFRSKPHHSARQLSKRAQVQWRDGSFPMEIVGESYYQEALIAICGPHTRSGYDEEHTATIELEPSNPYDSNAVVVKIQRKVVGYLARAQAARVGSQMREEGISGAECRAKICGGWRTNQYDEGSFGVWLAIPQWDWIDFGTGRKQPEPPQDKGSTKPAATPLPEQAKSGPLLGERIAIIGAPRNGELAGTLASHGARIMAGVGKTTTILVVAQDRPFSLGTTDSAQYQKAKENISDGNLLRILSESEARDLLGL